MKLKDAVKEVVKKPSIIRLKHAWLFGLLGLGYVAYASPTTLQSMFLVTGSIYLAAVIGYFLDRALFPYARPKGEDDRLADKDQTDSLDLSLYYMYRRTAIVCACIIAFALGI